MKLGFDGGNRNLVLEEKEFQIWEQLILLGIEVSHSMTTTHVAGACSSSRKRESVVKFPKLFGSNFQPTLSGAGLTLH